MKKPCVGVVGLTGQSIFMQVEHLPRLGETIKCKGLFTEAGGKGHNQAVACAKLGTNSIFVGAVGIDAWADSCRAALEKDNVKTILHEKDTSTACAVIMTDEKGNNHVAVYPGAAELLAQNDILTGDAKKYLKDCNMLLTQLELPDDCLQAVLKLAEENHIPVILNPAPAKIIEPKLLRKFYTITPNEEEAKVLLGISPETLMSPQQIGKALQQTGIQAAVVTLGENGALLVTPQEIRHFLPYKVLEVVDTTGAGDTFNGALASRFAEGDSIHAAVEFAVVASGLSVTRKGACSSIPSKEEIKYAMEHK